MLTPSATRVACGRFGQSKILKTQLSDDFDACDYSNVEKGPGVDDLKKKLRSDWRERWSRPCSRSRAWALDAVVDPFALSRPSHVPMHAAKGFTLSLAK
jgi:hypothetical protein